MVRKLALAMVFMAMTAIKGAYALGLGEIELHSALNQPLSANIELLSARPGEMDQAVVKLASREAFARAGVERLDVLSQLGFSVETRPSGETYLHVSTRKAVNDPFLTFLVEVVWPRGRLMREYTLLLDPPVFMPEAPAPVSTPVARPPSKPATQPIAAQAPAPVTSQAVMAETPVEHAAGEYGPTQRDETLWDIANRLRPDDSVSVNQMMHALLRANPEAFYRSNINNLKAGYVLRVPGEDDIKSMTAAEALAETRRQTRLWREYRGRMADMPISAKPTAQPKPEVTAPESESQASAATEGQLEIVAPEKSAEGGTGAAGEAVEAGASTVAGGEGLRKEVQLLTEATEAQTQENTELRTRVKELEKQLETLTQLVTLRNQGMSNLQDKAAAPKPAAAAEEQPPAKPEGLVDRMVAWIDDVLANPMGLLLAIVVVLLAALMVWLAMRRRRMGMSRFQESILTAKQPAMPAAPVGATAAAGGAEAVVGAEVLDTEEMESAISTFSDFPLSGMGDIHSEVSEVDPLSEADVYIAYGRYQQAEELIKDALRAEPGRHDLRLKLLEVYHATKNTAAFEEQASILYDELGNPTSPMWLKVVDMGRELNPENALFRAETAGGEVEAEAGPDLGDELEALDLSGLDLDLGEGVSEDSGMAAAAPAVAADELDLDLDLGESLSGFGTDSGVAKDDVEMASLGGDASELDFDLSDFDLGEGEAKAETDVAAVDLVAADTESMGLGDLELGAGEELPELGDLDLGELSLDEDLGGEGGFDLSGAADTGEPDELLGDLDEVGTKLDLARAYIDMGDSDGARSILEEVLEEGSEVHKSEAQQLLDQMS